MKNSEKPSNTQASNKNCSDKITGTIARQPYKSESPKKRF